MGAISIVINIITLVLVILMLLKDKPFPINIDKKLTLSATQAFNNMLSDDNAAASNRAEQPTRAHVGVRQQNMLFPVKPQMPKHCVTRGS